MQKNNKKNDFDCLAFKDQVQVEIFEETKHFSREELKQFFRRRAAQGPLGDLWKKIPARKLNVRHIA
jgi:hypothetical protein